MTKKIPLDRKKRKTSIFVNRFRNIQELKKIGQFFLQCGKFQWHQQLMSKDWCPNLLLLLVYCQLGNKTFLHLLFDDNQSIDLAQIQYFRNDNRNEQLIEFYNNVMKYLRQNPDKLKEQKQKMRQLFYPVLSVFAISLKLINFRNQLLTKENINQLNILFKKMLNGYKIDSKFGIIENQKNYDLTQLIKSIIDGNLEQNNKLRMDLQSTRKNQIKYKPKRYIRNKKSNEIGRLIINKIETNNNVSKTIANLANLANLFDQVFFTKNHPTKKIKSPRRYKRYDSKIKKYQSSTEESSQNQSSSEDSVQINVNNRVCTGANSKTQNQIRQQRNKKNSLNNALDAPFSIQQCLEEPKCQKPIQPMDEEESDRLWMYKYMSDPRKRQEQNDYHITAAYQRLY